MDYGFCFKLCAALGIEAEIPALRGFWKKPGDEGLQRKARPANRQAGLPVGGERPDAAAHSNLTSAALSNPDWLIIKFSLCNLLNYCCIFDVLWKTNRKK